MPSQTLMMSLRTFTINSLTGHSVNFQANEPRLVPAQVVAEAMEKGAVPVDKQDLPGEEPVEQPAGRPIDPQEAFNAIVSAMMEITERNNTEDFTASGTPKSEVVNTVLGWQTNRQERDSAFKKLKQDANADT